MAQWRALAAAASALLVSLAPAVAAAGAPSRHVVIVANNQSVDPDVQPLRYAVDDGAKYFELFRAAGAEVTFLAAPDAEAARRHPDAAREAIAPTRAELFAAMERTFERIAADRRAGKEAQFYFVFSGHGGLAPNREGYLNLLDAKLSRSDLYRGLLARSPADVNHLILDACHAYYVVMKRGDDVERQGDFRAAVKDFLLAEELAEYPNVGVVLASSASSETHEWSRWEAGIFSHELRSGLLGPADVDQDGRVTYAEAAAFVEAANAAIEIPRARLRVFYRPPANRPDVALLALDELSAAPRLIVEPEHADNFHVEDARAVRVADFHPSNEQPVRVALIGEAPFFVRTGTREALVPAGADVAVSRLEFQELCAAAKGSIESSFRRHLFSVPFGRGFYAGLRAERAGLESELTLRETSPAGPPAGPYARWRNVGLAGAAAGAVGSAALYGLASSAYDDYLAATTPDSARELRRTVERRLLASRLLFGTAGALAVTSGLLHWLDRRATSSTAVSITPGDGGPTISVTRTW